MPNETDKLFKTVLDTLPDAPPPGSAFDAEALWGTLDRQLRPRRRVGGWWMAAACGLLTLLAGLGWWSWFSEKETTTPTTSFAARKATHRPLPSATPPGVKGLEVTVVEKDPVASHTRAALRPSTARQGTNQAPLATPAVPEIAPVVPPTPELEIAPAPIAESVAAVLTKPVSTEKNAVRSKPRFRVVHVNELPSNETIPLKQPRTEATARVKLGFPVALQPAEAETPHVLILTKKPD